MGVSTGLWTLGQVIYTYYGLSRDNVHSFPSWADAACLSFYIPAIAALFAFPRPPARLISRLRLVLDVLVISTGTLFLSEAVVLHHLHEAANMEGLAVWTGVAYPVLDVTICALVFSFGVRQPPTVRRIWLCLGGGLVILALTNSMHIRLLADGQTLLTSTPLTVGWMAAMLLIGLATLVPSNWHSEPSGRDLTVALQLVPYLPVLGAVIMIGSEPIHQDGFLLAIAVVLLVALTVRQVMIVYENVTLTRDLEAKVAARTVELNTLGSIVTSSSDAIVGVSMDSVIIAWNPAAEQLFGHRAADVLGRTPGFLPPDAVGGLRQILDQARQRKELAGYEIEWPRPDGSTVPVAMSVSPILDGDSVTGISIFSQDVTERRQAAAALEKAHDDALESSRLKSEFLATMSHEIRTPMNGVIGLTGLLLETDLDDVQRQYAEGVRGAGDALLAVINDILDFSKLEAGKVVLDPADFDPRRLVEDVGALLAPAAFAKRVELVAYCLPDVPEMVLGDVGRVRQILLNLASNAVKFTDQGEVAIKARAFPLGENQVRLRFEVRDTGIGIAEQDRIRLFESFSQADASTTRRFGGTGLGLAISRRLVEVMGGDIGVDSEPATGSTFWFEVPMPVGSPVERRADEPRHNLLSGLRALVVEDNATNRTILESQLTSWKLRPDLVADGASALSRLREMAGLGQPYDLAILDMCMPEMSGLELARSISADPQLAATPMIMLTSSLQIEPQAYQDAGIGQWLTKPVRSSELYDRLMRLVAPKEMGTPARSNGHRDRQPEPLGTRGRILVVEDNSLNQLVAEGVLSKLGFEVHSVANGVEALEAMISATYSVVLMDCHMPIMDGFTATREIRRREGSGHRTPIIAMTAGAMVEDRERCIAAGMDDYVSKPVDLEALKAILTHWAQDPSDPGPSPNGSVNIGEPIVSDREPSIDRARLADLRELEAPDGSRLLTVVIGAFVSQGPERVAALRRAVEAEDRDLLRDAAHELKGASANIGARQLALLCGEVGTAAVTVGPHEWSGLVDAVEEEFKTVKKALAYVSLSLP